MTATLPTCRCCGAPTAPAFSVGDINQQRSDERFSYDRCTRCRAYQLRDVPPDLDRYYPPSYYEGIDALMQQQDALHARGQLETFLDLGTPRRLIEVGPGAGGLLQAAGAAGVAERVAVERDAGCCERLRADGVQAIQTDDPIAGLSDLEPADAVAMFHVIEHVPDPMGLLEAAAARVRPGGLLVVATPNPRSLSFKLTGRLWLHVDAPRHLFLLPLELLVQRARAAGLQPLRVGGNDRFGLHCNDAAYPNWARKLGGARGEVPVTLAARRLVGPLERRGLRGSTYTLVLRRP